MAEAASAAAPRTSQWGKRNPSWRQGKASAEATSRCVNAEALSSGAARFHNLWNSAAPSAPGARRTRARRRDRTGESYGLSPGPGPGRLSSMGVHIVEHPILGDALATLRDATTPPALFRAAMARAGSLLFLEAARDLEVD